MMSGEIIAFQNVVVAGNQDNKKFTKKNSPHQYFKVQNELAGITVTVYKEKGEVAAEPFLKGNESFIRKLRENRARKDKASY